MGRVDGPRGQRDGDEVVARRARRSGRGRLIGLLAPLVLLVGVILVALFPLQNLRHQRANTATAEAELAEVVAERERIQQETRLLETDEEIERRAREDYGYQRPGEEIYNVLPSPTEPIGLPETWPFTGVERALGAR